jgi:hypothetical protein
VDSTIRTITGTTLDLLQPQEHDIDIEDIAHGLAMICRFGGQIPKFYSVAQHSVLVAHLCPPGFKLAGLLHDASEAYIGDVIKPLKTHLAAYRMIERRLMAAVREKFAVRGFSSPEVTAADEQAYEIEHRCLRIEGGAQVIQLQERCREDEARAHIMLDTQIRYCWPPRLGKHLFLSAFALYRSEGHAA